MRVVVAMDSFKGSLSAAAASAAVARGIRAAHPRAEVLELPMADGGEGTAAVMQAALGGERVGVEVTGPLPGTRLSASFLWVPSWGPGALVEVAAASGLEQVEPAARDPMRATTRGVGELIRSAVERGGRVVRLALGGSATVDVGVGMARALGWRFLDAEGREVGEGGAGLVRIARIKAPPQGRLTDALAGVRFEALCDVDHPLLGPRGAAPVYAPQKGATPAQVIELERGLVRLAACIERERGVAVGTVPRGGAAGGTPW